MTKPKLVDNAYWAIKKHKEEGKYVCIPHLEYGITYSEKQKEVRDVFKKRYWECNEVEDVETWLMNLEELAETNGQSISEPLPGNTDFYLIDFDGFMAYFYVADEYGGMGESSSYVMFEGIVFDENISQDKLIEVYNWLEELYKL